MKNSLIRFQGQVVTVNVSNNSIEMITQNDEKLVFEANKDNFSIDYNVGNLGSAVCFDENRNPYFPNQLVGKFENGNTYSISELDYCTSVKGKTSVVHDKIFHVRGNSDDNISGFEFLNEEGTLLISIIEQLNL